MPWKINTAQMVTLWHAAIIGFIVSLDFDLAFLFAIIFLAFVIIFSLSGHPQVNKKKAILAIILPYAVIALILGTILVIKNIDYAHKGKVSAEEFFK